jgi:hypothetical protein
MRSTIPALGLLAIVSAILIVMSACVPVTPANQPAATGLPATGRPAAASEPTPGAAGAGGISLEEARAIAGRSPCAEVGPVGERALRNDATGTWWIDLKGRKPSCNPACVVHIATGAAEVNWRCKGLLVP